MLAVRRDTLGDSFQGHQANQFPPGNGNLKVLGALTALRLPNCSQSPAGVSPDGSWQRKATHPEFLSQSQAAGRARGCRAGISFTRCKTRWVAFFGILEYQSKIRCSKSSEGRGELFLLAQRLSHVWRVSSPFSAGHLLWKWKIRAHLGNLLKYLWQEVYSADACVSAEQFKVLHLQHVNHVWSNILKTYWINITRYHNICGDFFIRILSCRWTVSEACLLHSSMNTNNYLGHCGNNSTIGADTAFLAEQSISINNGELLAPRPMAPTGISQAPANTGM